MTEELDRLWLLSQLDEQIAVIEAQLEQFPQRRSVREQAVASERSRLTAHQAALAALQKQRREIEREIEGVDAQEKKFLGQQAAVKTNHEFQALNHEISSVKAKRSDLETRVLVLMDDEERNETECARIEKSLRGAEAELGELQRRIAAEESDLSAQAGVLAARRDAALGGLPAPTRQRYERAHQSRSGRGVAAILKGACGGCFRSLPPQIMMEAKRRDRLLICEGCGRLLVLPPDTAS